MLKQLGGERGTGGERHGAENSQAPGLAILLPQENLQDMHAGGMAVTGNAGPYMHAQ